MFQVLGARTMYDTKPLKACIHSVSCCFNHVIPKRSGNSSSEGWVYQPRELVEPREKGCTVDCDGETYFFKGDRLVKVCVCTFCVLL